MSGEAAYVGAEMPVPSSGQSSPEAPAAPGRIQYVDALRVGAIALVFLVHVCQVFNPWDEWHITNSERSRIAGEIALVAAPWTMPLIMLLAGVSAWHSLRHRSNGAYLRDRAARLLLPLAAGILILSPPQVYLERRLRGQFTGSFIAFYPHFFQGIYPHGNLSWHHLWFLAHLFLYSVLALPLFRHWQRTGGGRTMRWVARVCGAPGGILWLAVPLILERNALWGLFPERHMLTSDWSNHALLFVAYVYGFVLAGSPWLGRVIDAQSRPTLTLGVIGTVILGIGTWQGVLPARLPPPYSLRYLAFWTLYALCAWAWMVGVLGLGRRWLDRDGLLVRYGRRAGLAIYVAHQPIIIAVAYGVVQSNLPIGAKFALVLVVSAVATVACVEVLGHLSVVRAVLGLAGPRVADSDRRNRTGPR